MNLFTDECVYAVTTAQLRNWGHHVITAQEAGLAGAGDQQVLAEAVRQGRILLTNDLDFSNIRHYPPANHCGLIVLKIRPRTLSQVHTVLKTLLNRHDSNDLSQTLAIVDRRKYRLRRG